MQRSPDESKKMAVLVIHGIGEQRPFETLDSFVKGLQRSYRAAGVDVALRHDILWFGEWGESCISLLPRDNEHKQVDVIEYFWSHLTQRRITAAEVIDWIFQVARGAKSHYEKERDRANREKAPHIFTRDGELKMCAYAAQMVAMGGYLKYLGPAFGLMEAIPWFKTLQNIMKRLFTLIRRGLSHALVDFIGDIALYCTADVKSEYYETRTQILGKAAEKVKMLAMNDDYDEILLCGHSLGSVIAYDAVDRINRLMQHDDALRERKGKFKGMVTFGSPLDKVAFFFDEHIDRDKQPVRYATASFLHGFRRAGFSNPVRVELNGEDIDIRSAMEQHLSKITWLNFWTPFDVISGKLDVYSGVANIPIEFAPESRRSALSKMQLFVKSHNAYWRSDQLYMEIVDRFMGIKAHPTP